MKKPGLQACPSRRKFIFHRIPLHCTHFIIMHRSQQLQTAFHQPLAPFAPSHTCVLRTRSAACSGSPWRTHPGMFGGLSPLARATPPPDRPPLGTIFLSTLPRLFEHITAEIKHNMNTRGGRLCDIWEKAKGSTPSVYHEGSITAANTSCFSLFFFVFFSN